MKCNHTRQLSNSRQTSKDDSDCPATDECVGAKPHIAFIDEGACTSKSAYATLEEVQQRPSRET